jgi:hypothetical protein
VEPAEAIKNMLQRHSDMTKERSNRVARYVLEVLSLGRTLTVQQDKFALNWLCKEGFTLWQKTSKWSQYKIAKCASNRDQRMVSHPITDKAPYLICVECVNGTLCINELGRCNCQERTAYLHQCKHERAVLNGRFDSRLWQKRWSQRRSIVMSDGRSVFGGGTIDIGALNVTGNASVIGQPKQPEDESGSAIGQPKETEDESGSFPEGDDDYSAFADATGDATVETTVGVVDEQLIMAEVPKLTTKLSHKIQMELLFDLAKTYEGHQDQMEFFGAVIAQTRLRKGKGDSTIGSKEYLANYLNGYTSCRANDDLFSQMQFSQTETNDAASTTVPLAPGLVPFGCLTTSATGAPQRKRFKSFREQGQLTNSKKVKAACSFCCLPGHTVARCDQLKQFVCNATEILVDKKRDFAWSLVASSGLYQLETFNDETIWQQGSFPLDAYHVVILAMVERSTQGPNNDVGGTGLLVKILSSKAQPCAGDTGPTVYRSKAVSEWIFNKGQAKPKRLFSCLQSRQHVNQMDNQQMMAI